MVGHRDAIEVSLAGATDAAVEVSQVHVGGNQVDDDAAALRSSVPDETGPDAADSMDRRMVDDAGLLRYGILLTGTYADAQDLVQEAHLRLLSSKPANVEHPSAYLRTVMTRIVINEGRRTSVWRRIADLVGQPASVTGPEDGVVSASWLRQGLSGLPPRQRTAITMRYLHDATYTEIATTIGCREATARSLVARGLSVLRVTITDEESK